VSCCDSPLTLSGDTVKAWPTKECRGVTWPRQQWRHEFQQRCNNWSTVGRSVSRVSDQGFIGETEARLRVILGSRQLRMVRSWRRADRVNWRLDVCYSAVTFRVWLSKTLIVCVLRAVARKRLVETENLSACAKANWKVCKWAIAPYCCIELTTSECVTQLLINPIIRTRTHLISRVYQPTRHTILSSYLRVMNVFLWNYIQAYMISTVIFSNYNLFERRVLQYRIRYGQKCNRD
jgi:hypothetical protein